MLGFPSAPFRGHPPLLLLLASPAVPGTWNKSSCLPGMRLVMEDGQPAGRGPADQLVRKALGLNGGHACWFWGVSLFWFCWWCSGDPVGCGGDGKPCCTPLNPSHLACPWEVTAEQMVM